MKITLTPSPDESLALSRLSAQYDCDPDQAARMALRDWLIGHGHMELPEPDDDGE